MYCYFNGRCSPEKLFENKFLGSNCIFQQLVLISKSNRNVPRKRNNLLTKSTLKLLADNRKTHAAKKAQPRDCNSGMQTRAPHKTMSKSRPFHSALVSLSRI